MRILLIEDDPRDADRLRGLLTEADGSLEVVHADRLQRGLELAVGGGFDVVLLDIALPDSDGLNTFLEATAAIPAIPIVVLSDVANTDLAVAALRFGAEDYLVKERLDAENLFRALRYSMERRRIRSQVQQAKREMQALSLNDDVTGLLNWRGFITLSEQELKRADRDRCAVVIVVLGATGVAGIDQQDGHGTIREAGRIIAGTFRDSDVKARIGGGEFAVLAWSPVGVDIDAMISRFHKEIEKRNLFSEARLELKVGCAVRLPGSGETLDELVARAGALRQSDSSTDRSALPRFQGIEGMRQ